MEWIPIKHNNLSLEINPGSLFMEIPKTKTSETNISDAVSISSSSSNTSYDSNITYYTEYTDYTDCSDDEENKLTKVKSRNTFYLMTIMVFICCCIVIYFLLKFNNGENTLFDFIKSVKP